MFKTDNDFIWKVIKVRWNWLKWKLKCCYPLIKLKAQRFIAQFKRIRQTVRINIILKGERRSTYSHN
jgi:hypothetical protein